MIIHNPILTGSFTYNGADISNITSSAAGLTSLNNYTASQNILNGTYATTGSNTFKNPQTINSNLIVTGSITAATLVVQTITSSVVYSSGSNVFGNNIANTQVFTGSMLVTGSSTFSGSVTATDLIISDTYANDPLIKLVTTTSGNVEVQMRTATTTYNAGIGVVTSGYDFGLFTNNTTRMTISSVGQVYTSNAPSGDWSMRVIGNSTTSNSYGLKVLGGTNANDIAFGVTPQNGSVYYFRINGDGAATFSGLITGQANNNTFGTASATGRGIIVQAGSSGGGIMLKNAAGGDGTIFATGTSTSMNYSFNTYSVGDAFIISNNGNISINQSPSPSNVKFKIRTSDQSSSNYAFLIDNSVQDLIEIRNDGYFNVGTAANSPYSYGATYNIKAAYLDQAGGLGYNGSTRESKINITTINNADWITQLNPVTFNKRKKDDEGNFTNEYYDELHYGFIADEMEAVNTDFVFYDEIDGEKKLAGIHYDRMIAPLVKAIQELKAEFEEYKATHP